MDPATLAKFVIEHTISEIIVGVVALLFAGFSFLVGFFFRSIRKDIKIVGKGVVELHKDQDKLEAKFEGRFDAIQKDIRENTKEVSNLIGQVSALWRMVDGAHARASDSVPRGNGSGHG